MVYEDMEWSVSLVYNFDPITDRPKRGPGTIIRCMFPGSVDNVPEEIDQLEIGEFGTGNRGKLFSGQAVFRVRGGFPVRTKRLIRYGMRNSGRWKNRPCSMRISSRCSGKDVIFFGPRHVMDLKKIIVSSRTELLLVPIKVKNRCPVG
jgi:hypothetical protein